MSEKETRKEAFITYLEKHTENRAMLAELRRGLGKLPGEAPGMFPYVVPFVHNNTYDEPNLYLIASLFALHPNSLQAGNLGKHLRDYATQVGDDEAITRRFVQLLNLRRDAIDTPLRQTISLLKSKDVGVNWHQLLYDLRRWDHPDRFVQKSWASQFWAAKAPKTTQS